MLSELYGDEGRKVQVELLVALGRLSLFSRVYKSFVYSPSGDRGFESDYPTPAPTFHADILSNCRSSIIVRSPLTLESAGMHQTHVGRHRSS